MLRRFLSATIASLLVTVANAEDAINTGATNLIEVAPNIYAVQPVYAGADAALIVNDDFVVVVDSHGSPASAAALVDTVDDVIGKPIRYVINTHWHVDHHSGNEAYLRSFPENVDIIAHDYTRDDIPTLGREQFRQVTPYHTNPLTAASEHLDSGTDDHGNTLSEDHQEAIQKFRDGQEAFIGAGDDFAFTLPNLTIDKSLTIHGEPYTAQVLYLYPAHTRGDLVVYLPDTKILIAGDILTKPILWTWSSYPADYVRTLKALETLDIEKILIGHGGPVLEGKIYMQTVRRFMESLVAFANKSSEAGHAVEQAQQDATKDAAIQAFRREFVADNEMENQMFDQMVGWTVDRAMQESQ